jgi:hypothetical protein
MLALLVIKTSSSFRTSSILSPSSIVNLRCVLCSLAEAVSPGCTLMSERTPRDGWKEGFPPHLRRDNAKPPHISTVSVSVSFSSCKPLAESQVKNTMPRTQGIIQLSPSQHKTCFRRRYSTYPRRRAGAHARTCTPVNPSAPSLQAPTNPQSPNPVTLPTPMYLTSTSPSYLALSTP